MDWHGHAILAPLTKGGNLPFRRLCVDHGAVVTLSEMAYAKQVNRRSRSELALMRRHASETCFGVQLAAGKAPEAVKAGLWAIEQGSTFIDLNAGCPIHDVVRRGMGATLMQRPSVMARVVEEMVAGLPVPVTVKIRSGWKEGKTNAPEVARLMEEAGAAAVTLHARSREQRYSKAADWDLIAQLVEERSIPIIGNGDILTWYEARRWQEHSKCASVMVARGALTKPWIFQEIAEGRDIDPTSEERVAIYRRLACYMKEHFYDDEKGRERAMRFLPWHFDFFWRYRPLPQSDYGEDSKQHPLMQTRFPVDTDLPLLDRVLRDPRTEVHERLAAVLWDVDSDAEAVAGFLTVGAEMPPVTDGGREIATSTG